MGKKMTLWFAVTVLAVLLIIMGCRAAAPTATPVPPAPTKAPAPTVAPAPTKAPAPAATVAPAPTTAPAPAATVAPAATTAPAGPKGPWDLGPGVKAWLAKYPQVKYFTLVPPPTTQPKYGGEFIRSGTRSISHWDPYIAAQTASAGSGVCYGGLLHGVTDDFGGKTNFEILPDAAESWKLLDNLTWEFKLYPNVYWHDRPPVNGRRVTAEDLKWNLEKYRDDSIYGGSFKIISDIIIKDPQTLIIKTSEPFAHLIQVLGGTGIQFTAPEMASQPGGAKTWCIGWGPFQLVEYRSASEPWTAVRYPKYHLKGRTGVIEGKQLPFLDKVTRALVPDSATEYAGFIAGKFHGMVRSDVGDVAKAIQACPKCRFVIHGGASWDETFAMRLDKPPFNDVRVRRALSMAINRQSILDDVFQGVGYGSSQIVPDSLGWEVNPPLEKRGKYLQYNLTEAKRLMAEAGYPKGFKAKLNMASSTGGVDLAEVERIQFDWKRDLGVEIAINPMEYVSYQQSYLAKTYEDMVFLTIVTVATSWDSTNYGSMYSKSATNFFFIDDPEVDKWATASRTTFDPVKQREAYSKLYDLEEENIYRLNLVSPYRFHVFPANLYNVAPSLYTFVFSYSARSLEAAWLDPP